MVSFIVPANTEEQELSDTLGADSGDGFADIRACMVYGCNPVAIEVDDVAQKPSIKFEGK